MRVLTKGLAGVPLWYKAILVRRAGPPGIDRIAVQVQGSVYTVIPPAADKHSFTRIEGVTETEAQAILAAGYDCEIIGQVRHRPAGG